MTTPTGSLSPDTLVHGRYRVVRQIGRGGMGAVYEAEDTRLGNRVALKQTLMHGPGLDAAFEREARVLAALRHPALPVVSDYFAEGEGQFLVMQYIPGEDLATLLQQRGRPFSWAEVRPWAIQLLDALDYLHTQSPPIIHRDIKPQNLKLTPRGEIVLLDFGLAKRSAAETATAASVFGYTPYYAPLEQIQGSGTDPRSDLYSLAATLYALLTNSAPASALDRGAAVFQQEPDPLRPADELVPDVPPAVAGLLARSMALKIGDRPASAATLRDEIEQLVRVAPSSAGQATISMGRPSAPPPPQPVAPQPLPPRGRGWFVPLLLSGLAILCVVLIVASVRLFAGLSDLITIPGPDDSLATAMAALPTSSAVPTADPREEDPDTVPTVGAAPTQANVGGIVLPDVEGTVAAVQTEVAESLGDAFGELPIPVQNQGDGPAPLLSFGEEGTGQGFLDDPRGVAIGPDGAIYVSDYSSGRVQRFSPEGRFERGWLLEDDRPILALAVDRQGRVYVSQATQVSVFDGASGQQLTTLSNGYGFVDMVITAAGEVLGIPWASDDVVRLSAEGEELERFEAPLERADVSGSPQSLATDGLGTLYLLGERGEAVFIFGPDGAYRDRFSLDDTWAFSKLAVNGQGRIYVTGFLSGIHIFDGAGRPISSIPVEGVAADISFDDANHLYVVTNKARVLKFAPERQQ